VKALITGVAGFVGSHLAERVLHEGHEVVGVDAFTDYYAETLKHANLDGVRARSGFRLVRANLLDLDLERLLDGVDVVFHLAAQAGVRSSWGRAFRVYSDWNVLATQQLLEAARGRALRRFVYASSSAVYGRAALPMREDAPVHPLSPYGVSKLAAEHLAGLYAEAYGIPTVSLRYFTVFGPRQRPDMAFHRFIRALRVGRPIPLFGDGRQTRDFTFVGDVIEATWLAAGADVPPGTVLNVAGGVRVELIDAVREVGRAVGRPVTIEPGAAPAGEMPDTYADTGRAMALLGWRPKTGLAEGLDREARWIEEIEALGAFGPGR
jgi:UDP-glucose 4-epimerase